jgi:hypothetical protein
VSSPERSTHARSFLQKRLALMYRVGFALSAIFMLGVVVVRGLVGGDIVTELSSPSRWFHILATLLTGGFWLVLRGRPLPFRTLEVVDAVGIVVLSVLLHFNGALFPIRTVAVFNLALTTGTAAVLRAVVVPSTARRTLALGSITGVLAVVVFFLSALHPGWPVRQSGPADWPVPFQLISLVLWTGHHAGHGHAGVAGHLRTASRGERGAKAGAIHPGREDRRGRNGRGLPRDSRHAPPRDGAQAAAPGSGGRAIGTPLRARGGGHRAPASPEHGGHLRLRSHARGRLLLRHGVPGRADHRRAGRA